MILSTIAAVTLRGLLGRRRSLLLVLLALVPVLLALLARIAGGRADPEGILDALVVRAVLPLTALVFGTAAVGSELDDGTAVYVLTRPIPRWNVIVAKAAVAGALTAGLAAPSALLTGLLLAEGSDEVRLAIAFAVAVAVGAAAYVALFVAASVLTSRALILGLVYVVIWEGVLAGLLEGTRALSIREATLGLAGALAPPGSVEGGLEAIAAVGLVAMVVAGGLALASARLSRYEVRGAD